MLQESPLATPGKFLRITLSYDIGGANYLTGNMDERGYYLGTRVVTRVGAVESYEMFSGYRKLVEPAPRFSSSRMSAVAEHAPSSPHLPGMVSATLARAGEKLAS